MLQTYFDQIKRLMDRYATLAFVLDAQVSFELRPGGQGYLTGKCLHVDDSELFFREYLDSVAGNLEKLMYSYHYHDDKQQLIFRYDNARHRPPLATQEHKHTQAGVEEAPAPELSTVLEEIMVLRGWV